MDLQWVAGVYCLNLGFFSTWAWLPSSAVADALHGHWSKLCSVSTTATTRSVLDATCSKKSALRHSIMLFFVVLIGKLSVCSFLSAAGGIHLIQLVYWVHFLLSKFNCHAHCQHTVLNLAEPELILQTRHTVLC